MDDKNIFDQLIDHLDQGGISVLPRTKELYEMLEILFTPEQVEYAVQMPKARTGEISAEDLAGKMGKPVETVIETVETMARAGLVQAIRRGEDKTLYCSIFPLVPGMLESVFADGIDNDEKPRLAKLYRKYFDEAKLPEVARSRFPQLMKKYAAEKIF